jgi:hypothetical protein
VAGGRFHRSGSLREETQSRKGRFAGEGMEAGTRRVTLDPAAPARVLRSRAGFGDDLS